MSHPFRRFFSLVALLGLAGLLTFAPVAEAQKRDPSRAYLRSNPQFASAFRSVVARASESTVRVRCDGEPTALGVVVGADGWILTKAADLQGNITCRLSDGRELKARLIGVNKLHDLAMLRVEADDLTPIRWGDSKRAAAGDWVASAGTGDEPVAIGVVSVPTRHVSNSQKKKAPPPDAGYLGVSLEPSKEGVQVTQVMPDSGAAKAGLRANDLILEVEGRKVTEPDQVVAAIQKRKVGDRISLRILRDEEEQELTARLSKRPPSRGDIQNNMGSKLSSRTTGYPIILQHDSVLVPTDCGGPLVDLDGRVLGINISRAGRTESWAVPAEVITPLLAELRSGRLAPTAEQANAGTRDAR